MKTIPDITADLDALPPGDLEAIKQYLKENFKNFPEEVQKDVLFSFWADALQKQTGNDPITGVQAEGFDALEKLVALKNALAETEAKAQ